MLNAVSSRRHRLSLRTHAYVGFRLLFFFVFWFRPTGEQQELGTERGESAALRQQGQQKDDRIAELLAGLDSKQLELDNSNALVLVGVISQCSSLASQAHSYSLAHELLRHHLIVICTADAEVILVLATQCLTPSCASDRFPSNGTRRLRACISSA
jgi:hypothetical protein